ncbi:hypothetical protein Poli38472_010620 [Pythium oligandrum]|uniref:Uncharacterized protein n=1 Tax=Pythium oligandrum TaxID=41045 RepID=A0A8K1FEC7_PYTOL|nr:hypothetical protein Poli38472_010620 [Pythium oligandrum]|eukprot:TMW55738.1 hypothetical protein Poli38472_010620 [Pythium oligandrum]
MASMADVKIPPDWLRSPNFAKRSELYEARKAEMKQLALDKTPMSPYFDQKFARTESIFRDSYRKSGAYEAYASPVSPNPRDFHPRAIASGIPTRSVLLDQRAEQKRLESLKFEPQELLRLADIPKPGAPEFEQWWTKVEGYVADPSPMIEDSLRIALNGNPHAQRGRFRLGPVDPAKERSPASVEARQELKHVKAQLADKITRLNHSAPDDHQGQNRSENAIIFRASDLYAQERKRASSGEGSRSETLLLPVSPIKPTKLCSPKRSQRHMENFFLECTNQRALLDQFKTHSPSSSPIHSPSPPRSVARSEVLRLPGMHERSHPTLEPVEEFKSPHAVKGYRSAIRCGGFS